MPLHERTGDLFDATEPALAHGCNCAGAMGKGIAVEFRRRWPDMYRAYHERCLDGAFQPGDVFPWSAPDRLIYNLGTQRTWRTAATLDAVRGSVVAMIDHATEHGIAAIAMPRIAAGLGGLDWSDVADTISLAVPDHIDVVVYTPSR